MPKLLHNIAKMTSGLDEAGVWPHRKKDGTLIDVEIISHTLRLFGRPAELVLANDSTQLHQVLMNLCVNARDAMPTGGLLSLSAENVFLDEKQAGQLSLLKASAFLQKPFSSEQLLQTIADVLPSRP